MAADTLTRDEIRAMLGAVGNGLTAPRNRALLVVLWRSGLRIGEALALKRTHVANDEIHVHRGKGGKSRTVPIDAGTSAVVAEFAAWRESCYTVRRGSPLFCTLTGGPMAQQYVRALCDRLAQRAGLDKHVHPHMFRHSYAAELMREGFSARAIQALLGHADLRVTTQYLATVGAPAEIAARVRERPPLDLGDAERARVVGIATSIRRGKA